MIYSAIQYFLHSKSLRGDYLNGGSLISNITFLWHSIEISTNKDIVGLCLNLGYITSLVMSQPDIKAERKVLKRDTKMRVWQIPWTILFALKSFPPLLYLLCLHMKK